MAAFTPKPCAHCGGNSFGILPNVQLDVMHSTTVLGLRAAKTIPVNWHLTLVVCTHCGCTQMFTMNGGELAQHVPGATVGSV